MNGPSGFKPPILGHGSNSDMLQFPVIEILCACFVSIVAIRFGAKGAALGMATLTIVLLKLHMHGRGMFILQNAGNNFFVLKNMAQQAGGAVLYQEIPTWDRDRSIRKVRINKIKLIHKIPALGI
tara:strand:- start:195 stop:569 length:375 start_codon:yes stop_codon:yes gene_type:complete